MAGWSLWPMHKGAEDVVGVTDPATRQRMARSASVTSILWNVMLCLAKGAVGIASGSVAIVADAANNLSDTSSNVVCLLGFKLASKPADRDHPYGHGRYEYLASLAVALAIVMMGVDVLKSSCGRVLHPQRIVASAATVVVLVMSIVVKLGMMRYNERVGRLISSSALKATAVDARNDALATAAVLASTLISDMTGLALDGWMGVAVGCFVVWSGVSIVLETVDTLLGHAPDPELVARIEKRILEAPGVLGMHDLMIHDYGPGRQFASAHVEMAPDGDVVGYHEVLDGIERELWEREHINMTLHLDPVERKGEARVVVQGEADDCHEA